MIPAMVPHKGIECGATNDRITLRLKTLPRYPLMSDYPIESLFPGNGKAHWFDDIDDALKAYKESRSK